MPSKPLPERQPPAPPPLNQLTINSEIGVADNGPAVPSEHAPVFVGEGTKSGLSNISQQVAEWPSSMSVDFKASTEGSCVDVSVDRCYYNMSTRALNQEFAAMCKETESFGACTLRRQIYMSSQLLLIMLSGLVVSRVVVLVMRAYEKGECQRWSSRVSSNHRWLAIGVESIWCILLFLGIAAVL